MRPSTAGRAASRSAEDSPSKASWREIGTGKFKELEGKYGRAARREANARLTPEERLKKRKKRARRRNIIIASAAIFLMLSGIGLVGVTYYIDDVTIPENISMDSLSQSTVITYSDGTVMARLGDETRTIVTSDAISDAAKNAVVAAEDTSFYTNTGVDLKGILRAFVNNVTGGTRQGASTITQQYARAVMDDSSITYARKIREAVLAVKIKQEYDDDEILTMYLNTVYFGRSAYGIEAAAQAYFGKAAKDLTAAESIILAGAIKNPDAGNGTTLYDPTVNPDETQARFDYVKNNMVELGFLNETDAETTTVPDTVITYDSSSATGSQWGLDTPTGLIVHHVLGEVASILAPGESEGGEARYPADQIRNMGLTIVTTIDKDMQQAAQDAASPSGEFFQSLDFNNSDELQAALVAVEPGTGEVKAYYGGDQGTGTDYAGLYSDPVLGDGTMSQGGLHPPGSTMKVYTLGAALMDGYALDSIWDASTQADLSEWRTGEAVSNAGGEDPTDCELGARACTLEESVVLSLNIPIYAVTAYIGPEKVVQLAHDAGIRYMTDVNNEVIDLDTLDLTDQDEVMDHFNYEVGFGQYPISPLEHAGAIATIAARGYAAETHFVDKIYQSGEEEAEYDGSVGATQVDGLTSQITNDMSYTLEQVVDEYSLDLDSSRESAGKSGTWQLGSSSDNAHTWFVGYTARDTSKDANGLATAVWLGSAGAEQALEFENGKNAIGGNSAGKIWQEFMNQATEDMTKTTFSNPSNVGTKHVGNGVEEEQTIEPDPITSDDQNENGNNDENNNNNNNNNNPTATATVTLTPSRSSGFGQEDD